MWFFLFRLLINDFRSETSERTGRGRSLGPSQIRLLPSVAKISVTRQINSRQANFAALPLPKCRQLFVAGTTARRVLVKTSNSFRSEIEGLLVHLVSLFRCENRHVDFGVYRLTSWTRPCCSYRVRLAYHSHLAADLSRKALPVVELMSECLTIVRIPGQSVKP